MLTEPMADALASLAALLRADLANRTGCKPWDQAGIKKQLAAVARFPAEDVALAVIRAAVDQNAVTPGVIPSLDGPHWRERLSQERAPRNPLPHEECPEHPGQYRLACPFRPPCGPGRPRPGKTLIPVSETVREAVRAEFRRATAGLCSHGVPPTHCNETHDDPDPASEEISDE